MINPHRYEPKYTVRRTSRYAVREYVPLVGIQTRRFFRRASEAQEYAVKVHARWCRLYDAAIAAMMQSVAEGQ